MSNNHQIILVTGSAGFIGSNLVLCPLDRGPEGEDYSLLDLRFGEE